MSESRKPLPSGRGAVTHLAAELGYRGAKPVRRPAGGVAIIAWGRPWTS